MWYTWDYQYNLGHCLPMCLLSVDLKTEVLPYFALARSKCRGGRTLQHSHCSHFHHVVLSACACAHLPWCTWHTRARSSYRYHLYTYCISQCINFYRYNYHIITYHYWVGTTITLGTASLYIYYLLTWCYMTSPRVMKPSRPSPLSLYLHPEVIKYCRRRQRLGSKATKHYPVIILFLLSTFLTRLKRRDLRLLLPKTCTHFLVWKRERKVCQVWQDSQPLYVAVTALSVLLVSQNRRMRLGLLLPYQPQTRNKCSVTLLTAFTLMCIQSCKFTWILPTIHHNNTVLVKVPPQLPVRVVKLGWILVKLDPVIEGVEDHRL